MLSTKRFFTALLDFVFPPRCPICHQEVSASHTLCPTCFQKMTFLTQPCCRICGRPFEFQSWNQLCGNCLKKEPPYHKARAVLKYDDMSKGLILKFKHADRTEIRPLFINLMVQSHADLIRETDVIIPVPLHWTRLIKRTYNQADLLAKPLAKLFRKTYLPLGLKRIHHTKSQGHLSKKDRQRNIRQAFRVTNPAAIQGKRILLVDDVMTTGATVEECAKVLRKAGAIYVNVLTVFRVIKD